MTGISKLAKIEGRPLKIVELKKSMFGLGKSKCEFNLKSLIEILNKPENADEKICVSVVTGKLRGGKSFLLTCFIRYLEWLESGSPPEVDWINIPCDGFKSRYGSDRETTGVDIWSKLYTIKTSDGSNLKILLVDTQGLFDAQTHMQSCGEIFGTAALLSSVMIFNNQGVIGTNDLTQLAVLVGFANQALGRDGNKSLQKLVFLFRDFPIKQQECSSETGNNYLTKERQKACENDSASKAWNLFDVSAAHYCAYCLPTPEDQGAENGNVAEMGKKFGLKLRSFIEQTITDLEPKKMNGQEMTCAEFAAQLPHLPEYFKNSSMPKFEDIYTMTIEMTLDSHRRTALLLFNKAVEKEADGREDFRSCYETHKKEALAQFKAQSATVGEPRDRELMAQSLCEQIDKIFEHVNEKNNTVIAFKKLQRKVQEAEERERARQQEIDRLREEAKNAKDEAERLRVENLLREKEFENAKLRKEAEDLKKQVNDLEEKIKAKDETIRNLQPKPRPPKQEEGGCFTS
ncbi:hypothetical protein M3Y94_01037100 [Aphelenchoides besseyi]|nr:hypothetical protein M3Y94_01037100 [Aphelenchoides besseyi]